MIFGLCALVQGLDIFRQTPKAKAQNLATIIPAAVPGWTTRDLPLGPNEFVSKEAAKILNCDEVLNREYQRGATDFGVYVAYWGPGKMPVRMVACHTPDRCWTENGWHCIAMKFRQTIAVGKIRLLPAEWRCFEPPAGGGKTYVLFWHLVDGRLHDYGNRFNSIPDPVLWCEDALRQAFVGCGEQFFVRVTSNVPIEQLRSEPGFVAVLNQLGSLGLAERSSSAGRSRS